MLNWKTIRTSPDAKFRFSDSHELIDLLRSEDGPKYSAHYKKWTIYGAERFDVYSDYFPKINYPIHSYILKVEDSKYLYIYHCLLDRIENIIFGLDVHGDSFKIDLPLFSKTDLLKRVFHGKHEKYDLETGLIKSLGYYKNGVTHRTMGPARIAYDSLGQEISRDWAWQGSIYHGIEKCIGNEDLIVRYILNQKFLEHAHGAFELAKSNSWLSERVIEATEAALVLKQGE